MKIELSQTCRFVAVVFFMIAIAAVDFAAGQQQSAQEQGVPIHNGFGTGQSFLDDMSPAQQRAYAMGAINGMLLSPMFGASKAQLHWFESCVENMTDEQVAAIIRKHLRDHPERWHYGLHIESWTAMKAACGEK